MAQLGVIWADGIWNTAIWNTAIWAQEGGSEPQPPTLLGQIPDAFVYVDTGSHQFDLSLYFANATSYAIDPAVETGWDFNTSTGVLTVDTDAEDQFGPYIITATNADGDTDSNGFDVFVGQPPEGGAGFGAGLIGKIRKKARRKAKRRRRK